MFCKVILGDIPQGIVRNAEMSHDSLSVIWNLFISII